MDIYGMYDRLLEHSGKALRWLDRHAYLEAQRELELVVRPDGSYRPDGEARNMPIRAETAPPFEFTVYVATRQKLTSTQIIGVYASEKAALDDPRTVADDRITKIEVKR